MIDVSILLLSNMENISWPTPAQTAPLWIFKSRRFGEFVRMFLLVSMWECTCWGTRQAWGQVEMIQSSIIPKWFLPHYPPTSRIWQVWLLPFQYLLCIAFSSSATLVGGCWHHVALRLKFASFHLSNPLPSSLLILDTSLSLHHPITTN